MRFPPTLSSAVTDEAAVQTKELVEKGKGPLKSSAYVAIQCACCEQIVGRVYSTAPKKYSEICDKFCFHTNNLRTYSLGACKQFKKKTTQLYGVKGLSPRPICESLSQSCRFTDSHVLPP